MHRKHSLLLPKYYHFSLLISYFSPHFLLISCPSCVSSPPHLLTSTLLYSPSVHPGELSNPLYAIHYTLNTTHSTVPKARAKFSVALGGLRGQDVLVLYTLHCTLNTLHFTIYTVHCTVYTVHCKSCAVYCTLYNVHCILKTINLHFTLHAVH